MLAIAGSGTLLLAGAPAAGATTYNVNTTADTNAVNPAVSPLDSGGNISLRSAIEALNTNPGSQDLITVPGGTYTLTASGGAGQGTAGELNVSDANGIRIAGAVSSPTIIDANYLDRALEISFAVTLSGLTIEHGRPGPELQGNSATTCPGGLTTGAPGGGVLDSGALTLDNDTFIDNMSAGNGGAVEDSGQSALNVTASTFQGNRACRTSGSSFTSFGMGGAIDESAGGAVTIDGSTFSGNGADSDGGGLSESGGATMKVTNSTISGNTAGSGGDGGGAAGEGSGEGSGEISLFADTLTRNTATQGGAVGGNDRDVIVNTTITGNTANGFAGGGVENAAQTVTISFSTINGNSAPSGSGGNLANADSGSFAIDNSIIAGGTPDNCSGGGTDFTSGGHNVFDDSGTDCADNPGPAPSDLTNTDPQLDSPANNDGPTKTEALKAGSPAIDAADSAMCAAETKNGSGQQVDQRGFPRPDSSESNCDIGAFEVQDLSLSTTVFDAGSNAAWAGTETTGASAYDTSSLSGAVSGHPPAGSVTYDLFDNANCSGPPASTDTETLRADGSVPNSASSGPLAAGAHSYQASYNSASETYPSAAGGCERFSVTRATSSVSTTVFDAGSNAAWAGTETTGASAVDTSGLGGAVTGFTPSGTVTYSLFDNGNCSGPPASTDTETLRADGSAPNSTPSGALSPGSYSYQAGYSGDSNYTSATGPCEPFAVARQADLELAASPDSGQIVVGEQDQVTDTITNTGGSDATNVQFSDPAAGFTIDSVTTSQGTCTHTATTVSCSLGTLGAGHSVTVTILLTADSAGTITLHSSVSMDQTDPTPANNQATASIAVQSRRKPLADLAIDLTPSTQLVPVHHSFTYLITVSNRGPSDASHLTITDRLPAHVTLASVTPVTAGLLCSRGQSIRCKLGSLRPSARTSLTVKVRADEAVWIRDVARVMDASPRDPNQSNNTASARVQAVGLPRVAILPLASACYASVAVIYIRATAIAGAGVRDVAISVTGRGFSRTLSRGHSRRPTLRRNLQMVVKASALTPRSTYRVVARVRDSLNRHGHAGTHLEVCRSHSTRGFTG